MASPHTGSPKQRPVELLRIETNVFNLYIQGKPHHPVVDSLQLHRNDDGTWVNAHFHVISISSNLEVHSIQLFSTEHGTLMPWNPGQSAAPLFFENQTYEFIVEKDAGQAISFYHDNQALREAVLPKGERILSGMLNFQNEVGYTELELRQYGEPFFKLQLEIFPSKMDYKKDYWLLLHEVNEQIYNLSFDFLRKTYQLTGLKETTNQSSVEFFAILQHIFQHLVQSVERIQKMPHYRMSTEKRLVDAGKVKKAGKENVSFLAKRPYFLVVDRSEGFININGQKYSPTRVLETRKQIDYETTENRFVKWILLRIRQKLKDLKGTLNRNEGANDPVFMGKIDKMQNDIQRLLRYDFLQVGGMQQISISLVLQLAPGYREVYKYYLMLLKGLSIQSSIFRLSMKDLAKLYEYWCFLKIHQLLSRKYEVVKQDFVKMNRNGLFVTLEQGRKSRATFRNPKNGEIFTLYYNGLPEGDSGLTVSQRPDNVLTLKKEDSPVEYKYIFDAKYRLNPAYKDTVYQRKYGKPGPQEEDINTMHRYRDAIVYESKGKKGNRDIERSMFGAYVLFPYPNEEEFQEHHFYKSIELVNVGAIPFLPGSTSLMEKFLDELIMDSPEKAYERSIRPRGTKEYYANKFEGKNVVVGPLSSKDQLDEALKYGFYHTPLKQMKDHQVLSQLEYVAIYQSIEKFGREIAGIHYYGKIKQWEVLPRNAIKEIPSRRGASTELYVKFTVEAWQKREVPIVPGGHGIRNVWVTSKYLFDRAEEIAELRLESEEDLAVWREMRRKGKVSLRWDDPYVDRANRLEELDVLK